MGTFKASAQYNDFAGTSAADISDHVTLDGYFAGKGIITSGEHIVGVKAYYSETTRTTSPEFWVTLLVSLRGTTAPESSSDFRIARTDMPVADYLGLFKRFDIALTRKGLDLDGIEFPDL